MTETKTAKKTNRPGVTGFTEDEKGAMRSRVTELQRAAKRGAEKPNEEEICLAKIAEMVPADRTIAKRLHAVIKAQVPSLSATTWYGMPAYSKNGKIVLFFKPANKFKARYATIGFNDAAHLDDGVLWPTEYAITELTAAAEAKITALVKKAVS